MSGAFVAVIGPSGAGKDAVLEATRQALGDTRGVVFPRRTVTRPSNADEDHGSLTPAEFAAAEEAGEFALTWRAHGLAYGIPAALRDAVASGTIAVTNVSRTTLSSLEGTFGRAFVVRITASEEIRLQRILARGRETSAAARARVARPDPAPDFPVDLEIVNDGSLREAGATFAQFLENVPAFLPKYV
ncbi:MAG: phosphonate metabolism protein/1,5-bisphosphokinase (PRPP-forming) PhnN [Leucobacter sp.]